MGRRGWWYAKVSLLAGEGRLGELILMELLGWRQAANTHLYGRTRRWIALWYLRRTYGDASSESVGHSWGGTKDRMGGGSGGRTAGRLELHYYGVHHQVRPVRHMRGTT